MIEVGTAAPDFELPDQNGKLVRLSGFRGKGPVVVYFYPKDDTSGCTIEACRFRDDFEKFQAAGAEVIGISDDSEHSHGAFVSKYKLPFTLLSDKGGSVRKLYGVKKTFRRDSGSGDFRDRSSGRRTAQCSRRNRNRRGMSRKH